jgi:NAD(P)-dependent dehydrogenase (short-subunit alcohol dehydrogenase family)
MKVIVVGAFGTVGSKVVETLHDKHEVISVARTRGDVLVDYRDAQSIRSMYETIGSVDAVVVAAGGGNFWGPFDEISDEQFKIGLNGKLLGQINMVLIGTRFVKDGGSFTITSGILSQFPKAYTLVGGTVNASVDAFVLHASVCLPRGIRINAISPGRVVETEAESGEGNVTREQTANAYLQSIEGDMTGQVLKVWNME